ncbi:Rho GDP-dissociation inhibitor 1 [Camellia lanceoleosa]|nr:Rho GDP-dissociation inhibitor 1 [Camellia lanceoleosa]
MGLDEDNVTSETKPTQPIQSHSRQPSETSCYATEDEEEGNKEDEEEEARLQLGPICSIKEHLEKDKDDESLRWWKEQLLGSVDVNAIEATSMVPGTKTEWRKKTATDPIASPSGTSTHVIVTPQTLSDEITAG